MQILEWFFEGPFEFCFSDLQGVRTYAKKDGSDWILNGSKVGALTIHTAHRLWELSTFS